MTFVAIPEYFFVYDNPPVRRPYIEPTFQISRVCRQVYYETALLPYQLNTFSFHGNYSVDDCKCFDEWTKSRNPAQKKAVASLQPPRSYFGLYEANRRANFCDKFPGLKRLDITYASVYKMETPQYFHSIKDFPQVLQRRNDSGFVVDWAGTEKG
ncbi:hypothetical protein BDV96DRAFT_569538 [Lophiotrema nucula]|uniref:Uncharacterized protein n=1 Tax=Lophiotrema nucula TaxID=690887 RepID=A0A6A5ZFJ3_9PLEO|nr:hypothetical protein BDV96DRAFT_569538 [Lophiotrema nucula]